MPTVRLALPLVGDEMVASQQTGAAWELFGMSQRSELLRWVTGRLGTGYDKMLLAAGTRPMPFDMYLLRFPEGSSVPEHNDQAPSGRHFRLNIVLVEAESGGVFRCSHALFETRRVKLFRPDTARHSVSEIESGTRLVLSIGWVV
jgi:hypothetical protein